MKGGILLTLGGVVMSSLSEVGVTRSDSRTAVPRQSPFSFSSCNVKLRLRLRIYKRSFQRMAAKGKKLWVP